VWRMYPDVPRDECNPFSTAYALLGMLEAKKAGLNLSTASESDKAISESVTWLCTHFIKTEKGGGWNETNDRNTPFRPGLTFHVLTALLRADEAGFHGQQSVLKYAGEYLVSYSRVHPGEVADEVDVGQLKSRPVHFAVLPWRIACCTEYEALLKRCGARKSECISYEKMLHGLIANIELPDTEGESKTYLFALNMYALGRVTDEVLKP